jgi:predicted Zn-dependent protease
MMRSHKLVREQTHPGVIYYINCLILLFALLYLGGCGPQYTLMSEAQEAKVSTDQHGKIIAQYGGVYENPAVAAYVETIMKKIAMASERPDRKFKITVLDSPVVNAFALPNGYTYVTRGLLALANNEAEVAGVVGHEIAHVTARHSAQRHTAAVGTAVVAGILGGVANAQVPGSGDAIADLLNFGGNAAVAGFSRSQEYEADSLGLQTSFRAGYQPKSAADFLESLGRQTEFQNKLASRDLPVGSDWFSTHPNTKDRVARARGLATSYALGRDHLIVGREAHFKAIDGMAYGDPPREGFVRGRAFIHPDLKVYFDVPNGFKLINGKEHVAAIGSDDRVIVFDIDKIVDVPSNQDDLAQYMRKQWVGDSRLNVKTLRVSGYEAVRAYTVKKNQHYHVLAINGEGGTIYRFLTRMKVDDKGRVLDDVMNAIKVRSKFPMPSPQPLRVKIITVQKGDTISKLANAMIVPDQHIERFKVLNGLSNLDKLKVGQKLKTIY